MFDNVVINNGNGYDSSSGVFRAPSNGIYTFQFSGQQSDSTGGGQFALLVKKNGAGLFYIEGTASNSAHYGYHNNVSYQWELDLQEGDEINLRLNGGDTIYASSSRRLYFSGQLISLKS